MRVGVAGLNLIKEFEGYEKRLPDGSCQAYLDTLVSPNLRSPGYRGLWTIGYGCTVGVTEGLVWTEAEATRALMREVNKHTAALTKKARKYGVKLDQNSFDALTSASYNLGSASTLIDRVLTKLAAGDEDGAADVFLQYDHAGGRKYAGLTRRRRAERQLFLTHTQVTLARDVPTLYILKKIRAFFASLGLGAYLTWDNFAQLETYAKDHFGILCLSVVGLSWLGWKAIEYFVFKDHVKGKLNTSGDD